MTTLQVQNLIRALSCILILFASLTLSAQEICNNGIDDDGDNLIDLNDDECVCTNIQPLTSITGHACRALILTFDIADATSYQWFKDGIAITGFNLNTIAVTRFNPTGEGTYKVIATTSGGTVSSEPYLVERDEYVTDLGEITLCEGDSLHLYGFAFYKQGKQKFTTKTVEFNCDSTVCFEIKFAEQITNHFDYQLCIGETIDFNGSVLDQAGTYEFLELNEEGCDELSIVELAFVEDQITTVDEQLVPGDTIFIENQAFTELGSYEVYTTSSAGCDSLIVLNIVNAISTVENEQEIDLHVFPNPTNERITIAGEFNFIAAELLALSGEKLETTTNRNFELGHYPSGLYILRIFTEQGEAARKIEILD